VEDGVIEKIVRIEDGGQVRSAARPAALAGLDGKIAHRLGVTTYQPHYPDKGLSLMESSTASASIAVPQHELEQEVIALLISALNLEVKPDEVTPDTPLYGDGLGLDSIDILEIALAVSKRYGFQMRSDDPRNVESFASIKALSQYIAQERTK
jgi:acyl carrier protein